MTNILVIGSSGFIGSNLVRSLINKNDHVGILIRKNTNDWRIRDIRKCCNVYSSDLTDYDKLYKVIFDSKPDVIINCATYGVYPTQKDSDKIVQTNIVGTKNLINAIEKYNKIKKIINIGSYLELLYRKNDESKNEDLSQYASAKSKQTRLMHEFGFRTGTSVSTLRLFNPFGRFESPGRLVCDIMLALIKKQKLEIFSKTALHKFYHIDDVNHAIKNIMSNDNAGGKIFNLQTIGYTSVEELVEIACKATNVELDVIWKDEDQRQTHRNPISEQTDDITITPQISLETGLAETFVWYKNNIGLYKEFGV